MASSSSSSTSTSSSSSSSPCAACKLLRRKCTTGCVFAPYFPPDQPTKFANVHKVFGASNVAKLLNELPPTHREDAVNSLAYEADARIRDPVYGCVGLISLLQHRLRAMQHELSLARRDLAAVYAAATGTAATAGAGSPSDHVAPLLPMMDPDPGQQQRQSPSSATAGGLLAAPGGGSGGGFPARYHHVPSQLLHTAGAGACGSPASADPLMGTATAGLMLPPSQPSYHQHQQQQHQNFLQIMGAAEQELRLLREGYRPGAQQMQQQHHSLPLGIGSSYGFVGHMDPAAVAVDHQIPSPQQHQHQHQHQHELALVPHPGFNGLQPFPQAPEAGQQLRRAGSLEHRQALLQQQQYYVKGEEGSDADDGGRSSSGGGGVIGP